jgi:PAS domain S-box-containing protein
VSERPTIADAPRREFADTPVNLLTTVAPFAIGAALPYLALAFPPYDVDLSTMAWAAGFLVLLAVLIAIGIRAHQSRSFFSAVSIAYLLEVVLVRDAHGGGVSAFSALVFLPVLAIALYGDRRAMVACIVGIGIVLGGPILLVGGDTYPVHLESRRMLVWLVVATLVGFTVQELVRRTRESELQYRTVFDNVREVIFQTDQDGCWTLLNPAWEEITGYAVDDSIGRPFVDFVHPDDRQGNHELFRKLRDHEISSYRYEMRYRVADGEYRWLEVAARRTVTTEGETSGVSGTLSDVNDRHESERMKEQFFALVSHELRTPLAAIIGYLELLDEEESERLSEDGREFVQVMQRNSQRLMRLIGDLLFAAQVDAGTLSLIRGPVDLAEVAEHACASAQPRAEDRRIELECSIEPELPTLTGDRERLGQVLDNLITNALKFTPPGGRIDVRVQHDVDADALVLEVEDTGEGISEADQQRLFERFVRARSAEERAVQGVGLGLAITQAIVDGHGGRIGVHSTLGEGTTFRVVLPLGSTGQAGADD